MVLEKNEELATSLQTTMKLLLGHLSLVSSSPVLPFHDVTIYSQENEDQGFKKVLAMQGFEFQDLVEVEG